MRCLAEFILDSDLCLGPNLAPLRLNGPEGAFCVELSNAAKDHESPDAVISAHLLFEADSFDTRLKVVAYEKLTEVLNCLSYATSRKFKVTRLKRLIDWTPGIVEREAIIYHEAPEWDIAEPLLDGKFVGTAERLLAMNSGEDQNAAMRWYRLAIQASILEEQFSYFWFALEIAAQVLKSKDRIPSKCPKCRGKLFCETCNEYPTHRRYVGEAIHQVVETVHPSNAEEVFEALQLIRHTLMHGGRIASIRDQLPCTEQEAVNKLAFVTREAIWRMFGKADPRPDETLNFGYCDNLVRRTVTLGAHITVTMTGGDPNDPQLANFPHIQIDRRPLQN